MPIVTDKNVRKREIMTSSLRKRWLENDLFMLCVNLDLERNRKRERERERNRKGGQGRIINHS